MKKVIITVLIILTTIIELGSAHYLAINIKKDYFDKETQAVELVKGE